MTRTQQKVRITVPTERQIMRRVQRGMMMTWHSTINIQMTNTHSILDLNGVDGVGTKWQGGGEKSISNSSLIKRVLAFVGFPLTGLHTHRNISSRN